ncbi:MAG: ferredoxin [Myxococcales bacterium]|nr:ferredoxin [Myxococcales bacterium]MDD9966222.1 ferredoxin [Myxococcales bacterium]
MKIVVDFDLCQSHALCMETAPELFEVRDDGCLHVLDANPPEGLIHKAEAATLQCPTGAITLASD